VSRSQERFPEVYVSTYADLVRFVVRRGYAIAEAEDLAAEAFTVAWQRLDDLPPGMSEARAWLFGIARRLVLAQHRLDARRDALTVRIASEGSDPYLPAHDDLVAATVDLVDAWHRLTPSQQEALSLVVWEGLTGAQAAAVLGISAVAFRIRLSRARGALRRHLDLPARSSMPTGAPITDLCRNGHTS
jgi:RNA polymerase sigma-70 factor (ECF subfamily)